ncbi:MAG TPA: sensor histidine kinase [Steroidobacteraceae bacterium]|nr:sensor histidine kinase [Steroidobacteraceae bacterium]
MSKIPEDRARELSSLSHHLQAISEREKWELARKLHDELGGLLTAAKMDLSWLQSRLEGANIQERLSQLGGVLDEAMDLKRRVVEDLRPSLLDHFGLPTAVRAYVESTCAKEGLTVQVNFQHSCESMSKDTAIALFRVVQEGLHNIIRHAHARTVKLEMHGDERNCVLRLSDDGQGFDAANPQFRWSHGLMGMRQRAEGLGGRLDIQSRVGAGTTLTIEVPVSRQ